MLYSNQKAMPKERSIAMKYFIMGAAMGGMAGAAAVLVCPCFRPVLKRAMSRKKRKICGALRKIGI